MKQARKPRENAVSKAEKMQNGAENTQGTGGGDTWVSSTHWWQLCHSQLCRGRLGRKSAVPWFFTRCGKRSSTRTS